MGFAWFVTPERELPGIDASSVDGKALGQHGEAMDALALGLGLTPLGEFVSMSGDHLEDLLGDDFTDEIAAALPPEAWFPPEDGLATIRGLLAALRQDPEASLAYREVIVDLEAAEAVLVIAQAHGVRFHITPDF